MPSDMSYMFHIAFAVSAGWVLAQLSRDVIVAVLNNVVLYMAHRKQLKNVTSGYANVIHSEGN